MKKIIITVDGPAAAGKGTVAYLLARKYNLINIDSGAVYRAVAWLAQKYDVPLDEFHEQQIVQLIPRHPIEFIPNPIESGPKCYVRVGGTDVTQLIRTEEISDIAPVVGAMSDVRDMVAELEHKLADQSEKGVVVEGRDTGVIVFPEADLKFFLSCNPEIRAQRRFAELREAGVAITLEQVYSDLQERDRRDSESPHAAIQIPSDAQVIDSSALTIEQVVTMMATKIDSLFTLEESMA